MLADCRVKISVIAKELGIVWEDLSLLSRKEDFFNSISTEDETRATIFWNTEKILLIEYIARRATIISTKTIKHG